MPWNFSDMYGRQKVVDANVFPVMVPIFDTVLGASQATIDIQNIPQIYAHLRLVLMGRADNAVASQSSYIRFNGDAGANYADQVVRGIAGAASALEDNSTSNPFGGYVTGASATAGHVGVSAIDIPAYAQTTLFKNWVGVNHMSSALTTGQHIASTLSGVWANTAAINRITLLPAAGNWAAGTRATLYGVGVIAPSSPGSVLPVTYSTTLPSSPLDGQEAILVDNTSAPTYQWRFRYNASSSNTDKWEFVGGADALVEIDTSETTASTTYVDLTTIGPSFTVPRAGVYEISHGWLVSSTSNGIAFMSTVKLGAAAAADSEAVSGAVYFADSLRWISASRTMKRTCAASDVLKMMYRNSTSGTANASFANRFLRVKPVRVS